ncbi:hypothetical protein FOL46_001114 [Perkinsus olseni]|nr:hypothetical protein FOL46_001114 [Perkinsus olseni]
MVSGHSDASHPPDTAVIGCDGAGSRLRYALSNVGVVSFSEEMIGHEYKEVPFVALSTSAEHPEGTAIHNGSIHIWPREDFFLMALANLDGSFTGTIYARNGLNDEDRAADVGLPSFVHLRYRRQRPNAAAELISNPQSKLGSVRCNTHTAVVSGVPYLLVGDAAHAIVPFFGQGCNCGFEDCVVLDEHLQDKSRPLAVAFRAYSAQLLADTDAIADMALDNFVEMMSRVADPK